MYHYLATNKCTIVDIEPWITGHDQYECRGGVCNIKEFLNFYDSLPTEKREEFKKDFNEVDEIRGWFFEYFLPIELNNIVSEEGLWKTHKAIKKYLLSLAEKYGLQYGSD